MFVLSVRLAKKKRLVVFVLALCVCVAGFFGVKALFSARETSAQQQIKETKTAGKTGEQRKSFLQSFGWEVSDEPDEILEITIPESFDAVYEEYNNIQKTQQMDLSKYKGKRCKKYTYAVFNYPDYPEGVFATILVYNGKIIGGDVSCLIEDGFTHGFALPA